MKTSDQLVLIGWIITFIIANIGWIVAARYAIIQVELAHRQNIDLQKALLKQNARANLAKELLDQFSNVSLAMKHFSQSLTSLYTNIVAAEEFASEIKIDWISTIKPIEDNYIEMSTCFAQFETWLSAAENYLLNFDNLKSIYIQFRAQFTAAGIVTDDPIWLNLEGILVRMKRTEKPDVDNFQAITSRAIKFLNALGEEFKSEAKIAQKELFEPAL